MIAWMSRRFRPAGSRGGSSMDSTRPEPQATSTKEYRDETRAREQNNLRLALATFAVQLDAFEMRTRGAALAACKKPRDLVPPPKP